MRLDYQSPESLAPVIEALLFASDEPLPAQTLRAVILGEEAPKLDVNQEAPAESEPSAVAASTLSRESQSLEAQSFEAQSLEAQTDETVSDQSASPDPDSGITDTALTEGTATNGHGDMVSEGSADAAMEVAVGAGEVPPGVSAPAEKKRKKRQLIELVTIHVAVQHLNSLYEEHGRTFRIVEIAGGYQFATRSDYSEYVSRLFKEKSRRRLSSAALESLAIIAYKQPVSKTDVENIRGVNCDEVLKSLLEKNLITITGRADAVGRPLLYGTTSDFLRHFGLHSISDLPRPREIEELMKEEAVRATTLEQAASEFVSPDAGGNDLTVDEALAVARELAEREDAVLAQEEDMGGIELDVAAMETMNPGHPDHQSAELLDGTAEILEEIDLDIASSDAEEMEYDVESDLVEEAQQRPISDRDATASE